MFTRRAKGYSSSGSVVIVSKIAYHLDSARFCLIHPCDRQTDRQTELRWLRCAESSSCFCA